LGIQIYLKKETLLFRGGSIKGYYPKGCCCFLKSVTLINIKNDAGGISFMKEEQILLLTPHYASITNRVGK
jgi:hypothetical protein